MNIHNMKNERLEQCRVYKVIYTVLGRGNKPLVQIKACVVAMDVADLADEIRKIVLGVEITQTTGDGQLLHEVAESVEIESAELVGRLHGVTDTAHQIIHKCNGQEQDQNGF